MGSYIIDTMDERRVITANIPSAFLQGDWPQGKHSEFIMFERIMVDMICEVNPSFHNMVIWSKDSIRNSYTVDIAQQYTGH